jgi:phosphoribosylanthranilate isomerase
MVKVKICGITNLEDALMACELGVDALGFIFYDKSPRYVQPNLAKAIMRCLPPFVTKVGVFVNTTLSLLTEICEIVPIEVVQLHGDETPEYCKQILHPCLKVFRVDADFNVLKLKEYETAGYVLDTFNNYAYGGTGATFDWSIAKEANKFGRVVLSGGLNSDNILKALDFVRPYAVDVCSGVEASPGKKDPQKLKRFLQEFRKFTSG